MRNLRYSILLAFLISTMNAQQTLKDYKYAIVPIEFDFTDGQDKYRINSLLRHLFQQEGFEVFFDVQSLPNELYVNRCKAIFANLKKNNGGILKTKLQIVIKDCFGRTIMMSDEGVSKKKDYQLAYPEAIKLAFKSFGNFNQPISSRSTSQGKETTLSMDNSMSKKEENSKPKEIIPSKFKVKGKSATQTPQLYAMAVSGGYKVVNDIPEVVMELLTTSTKNLFMVKGKSATVFQKDGQWMYSEIVNDKVVEKPINIKF